MCWGAKREESPETTPRRQGGPNSAARSSRPTQSGRTVASRAATAGHPTGSAPRGSGSPPSRPQRTDRLMTQPVLDEFLQALARGFRTLDYGVIGGAALAKYGHRRGTSDIDVMIPDDISEVVEEHVLNSNVGIVITAGGKLGYIAADGRCYGLDITTDRARSQIFRGDVDTVRLGNSGARFMNPIFLLNSKAYSYLARAGRDAMQKKEIDGSDIAFLLGYMRRANIRATAQQCRWVVDHDFWTQFTRAYEGQEAMLEAIGLQRERTPSSSNRSIRRASSERSGSSGRSR